MKAIESKIRVELINFIEKIMENEDYIVELDMWFSDTYSERMADAALNTLMAMQELVYYLRNQGELSN